MVVALLALALPEPCEKLLPKKDPVAEAPGEAAAPPAAAPATTPAAASAEHAEPAEALAPPPVWTPPEPPPPAGAAAGEDLELTRAKIAAAAGEWKRVRALLEKKVRAGKGSDEEAALLADACAELKDKACLKAVHARHPGAIAR
jgi:hypothetical protein